jgi:hypothetical protein
MRESRRWRRHLRGREDRVVGDMADTVRVQFQGEGTGEGELSWGQKTAWRGVLARGSAIWLVGKFDVPEGRTVEDIADGVSFLMSRHDALRTKLVVSGPDDVRQVVHAAGELDIVVVDVPDDDDPHKVVAEIDDSYDTHDRDYAAQWPVEVTIVRHRGVPVTWIMAMCHTSADGFSLLPLMVDLETRDPVTGAAAGPVTSMTPLEQANLQTSPVGQKRSAAVERHWERVMRTMPPRRFPPSGDPREPRYWRGTFSSPALFQAMQVVAQRTGFDTSPVLLAAFAVGLASASGINPAVPRLMVNNRFRPRLADSVGPLSQTCPCVVDVGGMTFDEAVRRAYQASLVTFKNAYFEPVRIREIVAAASAERGQPLDVDMLYNDRRSVGGAGEVGESAGMGRGVTGPLATPDQLRAAQAGTTLSWEQGDDPLDVFHLHVADAADTVKILVLFDTQYASPDKTEALLRRMESVTVEAAIDPATVTGIPASTPDTSAQDA